jgi:hypothetical protein
VIGGELMDFRFMDALNEIHSKFVNTDGSWLLSDLDKFIKSLDSDIKDRLLRMYIQDEWQNQRKR